MVQTVEDMAIPVDEIEADPQKAKAAYEEQSGHSRVRERKTEDDDQPVAFHEPTHSEIGESPRLSNP